MIGDDDDFDLSFLTFSGNVLYQFPLEYFVPYGTVGLGLGRTKFSVEDSDLDEANTDLTLNLGGGAKFLLSDQASFRSDLRYFNINDGASYWRLYAGVTFHLGS